MTTAISGAPSSPRRRQFTGRHCRLMRPTSPSSSRRTIALGAGSSAFCARWPGRSGPPTRSSWSTDGSPASTRAVLAAELSAGRAAAADDRAPAPGRPGDGPRRGLARQRRRRSSRSPTTTAPRPPAGSRQAERAAARQPGLLRPGPDAAEPGRDRRHRALLAHDLGRPSSTPRSRPATSPTRASCSSGSAASTPPPSAASPAARTATSPGARSRPGRGRRSRPRRSSTTRSTTSGRSASCASRRAGRRR